MSKRVQARKEAARLLREQEAAQKRRQRTLWTAAIAVAALVLAGIVGWGVYQSQHSGDYATPKGAVANGAGLPVSDGPVTVDVYLDYMCPACKQFEQSSATTLDQWVSQGKVKLVLHPLAFLNRFSNGTQYSTRSAAAAACANDGGKLWEYSKALYNQQPAEGSSGLTDDQLIQIGGSVGLVDPSFASCVRDGKYTSWTQHANDEAAKRKINATPTVYVDGKQIEPTVSALTSAVDAAGK